MRGTYSKISNKNIQFFIILACDQGKSVLEVPEMLQVNYSSARGIVNKYKKFNIIHQEVQGGSKRKILTKYVINKIKDIITFNLQFTLS